MKKEINKILVIRFRRVGDAVLSSAICSSLRKSFPQAEIHYVLNANIAPLFENHPDIDKLIPFSNDENNSFPFYLFKIWKLVHNEKYDIIVDCRSTVRTLFFSLFSFSTPYRLGIKKKYNRFIQDRTDIEQYETNVDKMLSIIKPLENEFKIEYIRDFKLKILNSEINEFKLYMEQQGIDFSKPIIVCTVAARLIHKIWDLDFMSETLLNIIAKYDAQLIFNFAGDELTIAQSVKEKMGNSSQVFINIDANSLRKLGALLKNSDFFFGNEGGPRHIAQALDIPAFAIYPPETSKKDWLPNESQKFQGIEPSDILDKKQLEILDFKDAFDSMTPKIVCEKLFPMLDIFLKK